MSDPEFGEEFDVMVDTIVDQYLEDELTSDDRDRAERYFFKTTNRREKLKFAAALKKRKDELVRERSRSRTTYLRAAAIAFVAIGVGAVAIKTYFSGPSLDQGLSALHSAYRDERPFESRISGFNYAPARDLRGGTTKVDAVQKDLAASIILAKSSTDAGAKVLQAIGQYYLSQRRFDEAIDHFQRSLTAAPDDPRVHGDLGVALLERGKFRNQQSDSGEENIDFATSLVHLNKALELDGANQEALFNRALLFREMGLLPQSEKDWRQYLEKDSASKWADEARDELQKIEQQRIESTSKPEQPVQEFLDAYKRGDEGAAWNVVRRHYSSAGNTITNELLDAYLDSDAKGDNTSADSNLAALEYVASLELKNGGDTHASDLVRVYKRSNPQQRREFAHARAQLSQAYDLFLRSHVNDALGYYSQAEQTFRKNGNDGEATLARYRIGHCYWLKPDLKKSEEIFTELREVTERSNYKWLFNQSIYRTASIRLTYNDYSQSIDYARQALRQTEQMGDTVGILNALLMLTDQYRSLNDLRQSWPYVHRAVLMTRDTGVEPLQRWGVVTGIAQNLAAMGIHEAALEYQKEALRLAVDLKPERPLIISRSYDYLALTYARLKNYDAALTNINLAFESGRRLEDQDSGSEMMATTSLHAGDIFREAGQYDNALASYDRSIQLYEQIKYPYFTYPARKGRLLLYLAKGNDAATEAELNSVLQLFDTYRASLKRESQRHTFFNVEQSVYDLAMDFAWSRKRDAELAFKYSELSRGRSLLDAMRKNFLDEPPDDDVERRLSSTGEPLSVAEIKLETPDDAQIVQYAVLEDKLLIWVVKGKQITPQEKRVSSRELGERVRRFVKAVGTLPGDSDTSFMSDANQLYQLLIAPIASLLDPNKLTCIVPDKALHYLPFGALVSESGDEYLVRKFRIQLAPSSSIFLESLKSSSPYSEEAEERILSVGNPTFDPGAFPSLQRLPAARDEAQTIAKLYKPSYGALLDRNATEQAVRNGIQKSNVAHFALHYVVDERHSLYSKMILTPPSKFTDNADDGLLQIHEIYKMDLAHMRLVVLSACQTAIEQQYSGEGAVSVARPFLASRVPLVVATLWPVDSSSSERLMTAFHRHRKEDKFTTAHALQQAQTDILNDDYKRLHHPYYWAAFTVIGRYANF
ncbi:MAG TPA: CHAT domain-containing protein [Pyrinomonadaceae bacterium]|nr:CHAT domain-containing protein [Pyrinomonadaceae bacterium]